MSTTLTWTEIALRLALALAAGVAIGLNRSEHSKAAGMRTTVLVCLAAAVTMIQVNLLLPTAGRTPDSFVMNDLMRLPLGILTGVGFIGGGAILRRDNIVTGVTTAATLWLMTVIGLCLGGGQIALGLVATMLGLFALWGLRWIESGLPQERRVQLSIEIAEGGSGAAEIQRLLVRAGMTVAIRGLRIDGADKHRRLDFEATRVRLATDTNMPTIVDELTRLPGIRGLTWRE